MLSIVLMLPERTCGKMQGGLLQQILIKKYERLIFLPFYISTTIIILTILLTMCTP